MKNLAIIGGGSWGTALAVVLAPRFERVRLWVYEQDLALRMRSSRENDVYLPGFRLPANVDVHHELASALETAEIVLGVMPSHLARPLYREMAPHLAPSVHIVSATKGLETGTLLRVTEVIRQVIEPHFAPRVAVISGPTFAREVARGDPTALVVASTDAELLPRPFRAPSPARPSACIPAPIRWVSRLAGRSRTWSRSARGVCHGLGLGHNAVAALITRGLAEISTTGAGHGWAARRRCPDLPGWAIWC